MTVGEAADGSTGASLSQPLHFFKYLQKVNENTNYVKVDGSFRFRDLVRVLAPLNPRRRV
jgi:hypothetical protein